jgi:hypothetical protein
MVPSIESFMAVVFLGFFLGISWIFLGILGNSMFFHLRVVYRAFSKSATPPRIKIGCQSIYSSSWWLVSFGGEKKAFPLVSLGINAGVAI